MVMMVMEKHRRNNRDFDVEWALGPQQIRKIFIWKEP